MNARGGSAVASVAWLCACLLAACSSPPRPPTGAPTPRDLAVFETFDTTQFPGAEKLLAGFVTPEEPNPFRVGDAVLFGLVVGDGTEQVRRLLRLEVRDLMTKTFEIDGERPLRSTFRPRHTARVQLTRPPTEGAEQVGEVEAQDIELTPIQLELSLYDEHGAELSRSRAVLYDELLLRGLWPIARETYESKDGFLPMVLLHTLQRLGADDEVLSDLLFTVVEKPSLFSVLIRFGVEVVAATQQGSEGPTVRLGDREVRCNVLPMDLDVNGSRALSVHLFCTEPRMPDAVGAGIVGALARHPSEPRFAAIRLMGTRRGAAKQP